MTVWSHFIYDGGFWFRLFGWGFSISDKIKNPPLFSERNGYKKVLRVGKWGIGLLIPPKAPSWDEQKVDEWNPPDCDPIKDCMSGLTAMGYSEREAEIFLECLMGKREYNMDLHFDFMTGKLRRSLEKK